MLFAVSFIIFNYFYNTCHYWLYIVIVLAKNMCRYYQTTADQRLFRGKPVAMFLEF